MHTELHPKLETIRFIANHLISYYLPNKQWGFRFNSRKNSRRLGACFYRQKMIEINQLYAYHNPLLSVVDTILHEIAHAIAYEQTRTVQHHNPLWHSISLQIGCNGNRTGTDRTPIDIACKWGIYCPNCGKLGNCHRKLRNRICSNCKKPVYFKEN